MDTKGKLAILADAAKYDASCASSGAKRTRMKGGIGDANGMGICHSYTPDGRCVSLLKILLTNYCIYDCQFCINRVSSATPRARFTPDEVVNLTLDFYKRNYIEGLFLSSGIIQSVDYTMELLVAVARSLRETHRFGGYIHLKTIPGADPKLLALAGSFADRLSVNIELPRQADLDQVAPAKRHTIIEGSMAEVKSNIDSSKQKTHSGKRAPRFAPAGQTTQLIVGATAASDLDILKTVGTLYERHRLRRVYYSGYSPIPDSAPGLSTAAPPLVREHRLYQADWLYRFYGFSLSELVSSDDPNLSLEKDPKLSWALKNRHFFPVDINRAERALLLRVPGFGVRTVDRIIKARVFSAIDLAALARMRVPLSRAKYFIETADKNSDSRKLETASFAQVVVPSRQLSLFDAAMSARSGQL